MVSVYEVGGGRSAPAARLSCALLILHVAALSVAPRGLRAQGGDGGAGGSGTGARSSPVAVYPVAPTPVLEARALTTGPAFSGYLSVRNTRRNDSTVSAVNRARLTVTGLPYRGLAYRLQGELSAVGRIQRDSTVPASVLTDAFVQLFYQPKSGADSASRLAALAPALIVGQFRVPFSLEYLTSFSLLKTANRSLAVDRLAPRRDIGAMGQVRLAQVAVLMASLTNGEGPNQPRNPDNTELAAGRLVVRPHASLAVAGKWAGGGPDHYWGYDARWVWRTLTVEGEAIRRTGRTPGGPAAPPSPRYDAGGGYALAAWRVRPWVEPEVKWERLEERTSATSRPSETWVTPGVVLRGLSDRARLHVNWIVKRTHPVERRANELQTQLIAIF